MPKVSVLMPVYNTSESYLREAIESILNQTYTDFEFIIINDGSTNNAQDVILSYKDERIVYVKNEQNLKLIKTLNKGLDLAKGEYILRMDADDISREIRIECSVKFMDENPNIAVASSYAFGIPKKIKYKLPTENRIIKPFLRYIANCMMHPAIIMRTSVLRENNFRYDERYIHNEDYKLWIDINEKAELANIGEFLLMHRLHDESVSAQNMKIQQTITHKILWENLIKDFAPRDKKLIKIVNKYFDDEELSLSEFRKIDVFLCKALSKIKKILDVSMHKYLKEIYKGVYKRYVRRTKPSLGLIFLVWISSFCSKIGAGNELKNELTLEVFDKMQESLQVSGPQDGTKFAIPENSGEERCQ